MPLIIELPEANQLFNITATPAMPTISCRARITREDPDPTATTLFNWTISITEAITRDDCPSSQNGNCVRTVSRNNVLGGTWTPIFDTIQGGAAVITATAVVGRQTLQGCVTVRIRGTNPAVGTVTTTLGGAGTAAELIARHESQRCQFNANGMPLLGPGGDVGIMQLCNPAATCVQRWSWTANLTAGQQLLAQKQTEAQNYLNQHLVNGAYPNSLGLNNANVRLRETIQRYNGGRYWSWNARTSRWENNPPNNYVALVLGL